MEATNIMENVENASKNVVDDRSSYFMTGMVVGGLGMIAAAAIGYGIYTCGTKIIDAAANKTMIVKGHVEPEIEVDCEQKTVN